MIHGAAAMTLQQTEQEGLMSIWRDYSSSPLAFLLVVTSLASRFSSSVESMMKGQSGLTPSQPLYLIII